MQPKASYRNLKTVFFVVLTLLTIMVLPTVHADSGLTLPLSSAEGWKVLSFRKIPKNEVQFSASGLQVVVNKSAGPIVYKLPNAISVREIHVVGQIEGELKPFQQKLQGSKGQDDFLLRVGLVISGNKKLNFWQRKIAPEWVQTLHGLAGKNEGIDRIDFYNIVSDARLFKTERRHPLSELLYEHNVWQTNLKSFDLHYKLPAAAQVVGVWLSLDGDDTGSQYKILLKSLRIN